MAYYEMQCPREMREAYTALLKGTLAVENAIRVPYLPPNELNEVYTKLRLDHPEIFYLTGFRVRSAGGADYAELLPEYLFSKDKILTHKKAIAARVERLTRPMLAKTEQEKLAFVHGFITENVRYDKLKKPYSHEIIGPLTQGVGVCEGIAKTVKLLCDALHVECLAALSLPEEGKRYGHMWNTLKLGGRWYQMDATFDLTLSACGENRWDYCLLSDAQFFRDHVKPAYPVPECVDGGCFYYKAQKLSFTKEEELCRRITQAAKKKKPRFVFHWRGGYLTREVLQDLLRLIGDAAAAGGRHAEVSLNRPQSVFCVHFSEQDTQTGLTMENADEA